MSQRNVDAVRRSVEAANRGEPEPWSDKDFGDKRAAVAEAGLDA